MKQNQASAWYKNPEQSQDEGKYANKDNGIRWY
ncbi:MAG: hypothetical protein ACJA0E_001003 [Bermanella sp.]|jgi:hypothetical protein